MADKPQGKVTIQTIAMPADTNANGDIFGGWLLSQMDLACGVLAKQLSNGRIATVAVQSMTFLKPVHVGDLVSCHASLIKEGHSSMTILVEVWTNSHLPQQEHKVTEGTFISVAIDDSGRPRPIKSTN
jgi:acyl-CoA thioesterase YciA